MRRATHAISWALAGTALACAATAAALPPPESLETLAREVTERESAFARTMAERRFDLFADFVGEDAVFRGATLLVGRQTVLARWKSFYDAAQAPFSWRPDLVTVAADGRSAVSTGPVSDAQGRVVSRFMTLWRREADGRWRVAVDQGVDIDACVAAPAR